MAGSCASPAIFSGYFLILPFFITVVDSCPTLRIRPKSSESVSTRAQDIVGVIGGGSGGGNSSSNNSCSSAGSSKKREDLTSLGSDDSGKATARARTSRASLIQSEKTILHSHLSHTHFVFVVYYNFHVHINMNIV